MATSFFLNASHASDALENDASTPPIVVVNLPVNALFASAPTSFRLDSISSICWFNDFIAFAVLSKSALSGERFAQYCFNSLN